MSQRESRYVKVAKVAYRLTQQTLPKYSRAKSPHQFEFPQLAVCVLLMFYLNKSYRDMEEWLLATDRACQTLALARFPDRTTLQQTYRKLRKLDLVTMKNQILEEENIEERVIASDCTGFSPGQASLYYQTRSGCTYRHWLKGAYAVGTESQYILAWQSGYELSNDTAHLSGCARFGAYGKGKRHTRLMLTDAGFDTRDLSSLDIILPIRRYGKRVDPDRKAGADLAAAARPDGLFGHVGKQKL